MTIHILATGTSRGIGAAIAASFGSDDVRLVGHSTSGGDKAIAADLSDPDATRALWWEAMGRLDGRIDVIRNYCETDVLNTFLIFLRFELMRGRLLRDHYLLEVARVREALQAQTKPHFQEFLAAWTELPL